MAQKLTQDVLEKFKLERDPFVNELRDADDVFMSKAHKKAEWLLTDAAQHQYFVALVAPIGAGKTVILKRVMERLRKDGSVHVSRMQSVEKERATAYGLCEALIRDFSAESPRRSREARARQLGAILEAMVRERKKPVLVIDEAHALNVPTLRPLKRLYDESEQGFRRSIAILLIGQNSNADKGYNLDLKLGNWDLREVSERCQVLRLGGLGNEVSAYLAWKFERVGCRRELVTPEAVKLLTKTADARKGEEICPLFVNNLVALALTCAWELDKDTVTTDVMKDALERARA